MLSAVQATTGPGVDTSAKVSAAQAAALLAAGKRFIMRCVCLPSSVASYDLDGPELAMLVGAGLQVGAYAFFRRSGHSVETGTADAIAMANALDAIGYPKEATAFVDLECDVTPSAADARSYALAWSHTLAGRGRVPGAYVDQTFARSGAAIADLFDVYWESGGRPTSAHGLQFAAIQDPAANQRVGSLVVDLDVVQAGSKLMLAGKPGAPVPQPAPIITPPSAPTGDVPFSFHARAGESVGDRRARCCEEALANGPMGHTLLPVRYASFINACTPAGTIAGHPVASIASWATSCLITQEAVDHHCGGSKVPPRNGAGFFEVYPESGLRKPDGKSYPERGDVVYVASNGTNGHVVCVLHRNANGTWTSAAGGGGADGTHCSIYVMQSDARGYPHDGRPCQGWWPAATIGLPASPASPAPQPAPLPPPAPTPPPEPAPSPVTPARPNPTAHALQGLLTLLAGAAAWTREHAVLAIALVVAVVLGVVVWRAWPAQRSGKS